MHSSSFLIALILLLTGIAEAARAPATSRSAASARSPATPRTPATSRVAATGESEPVAFDFCVNNQSGSANDSNSGVDCTTNALLTVQGAVDKAGVVAGKTILVKQGTYNERITIAKSGSAGNPITIIGECANSATTCDETNIWQTIINGALDVSSSWTLCTTAVCGTGYDGAGVYRKSLGYKPWDISDSDRQIMLIAQSYMDGGTIDNFGITGDQMLQRANTQTRSMNVPWENDSLSATVNVWDGIEALCGYKTNGYTYCRWKNEDDANGKTLRASPGAAWDTTPAEAAIMLNGADYLVIKNLQLQGSQYVIALKNGADNNIIEYNKLVGGTQRIRFYGSASNNTVRYNVMNARYLGAEVYGDNLFAWTTKEDRLAQYNTYEHDKFPVGQTDGKGAAIELWNAAIGPISGNAIYGNKIYRGDKALRMDDGVADLTFHSNEIYYFFAEGIYSSTDYDRVDIYDNTIAFCGQYCIRFDNGLTGAGPTYIYRNKFYSNHTDSTHPLAFFASSGTTYSPTVWVYHNSISQGFECIQSGDFTAPNVAVINNLLSCSPLNDTTWTPLIRAYNWMGSNEWSTTCDGAANSCNKTNASGEIWADGSLPDFILPTSGNGSNAIDGGLNISAGFTLGGTGYSALPGFSANYWLGSAPDIGCCERQ